MLQLRLVCFARMCVTWNPLYPALLLTHIYTFSPGVIGSALGLVGPVSVYCDWVRWKV